MMILAGVEYWLLAWMGARRPGVMALHQEAKQASTVTGESRAGLACLWLNMYGL